MTLSENQREAHIMTDVINTVIMIDVVWTLSQNNFCSAKIIEV